MASKNIQLRFDIDNRSVDIASESVLTLTEQIRFLKKEIGKGGWSPEQFNALSSKLNETKDRFAQTNARSRELFSTLSLLPGPIGQVSSSIDGAIGLLKTFSGFKLTDLKAQVKGFGNDLRDIFASIGSFGESTKEATDTTKGLAKEVENASGVVGNLNTATGAQIQANVQAEQSTLKLANAIQNSVQVTIPSIEQQKEYIATMEARRNEILNSISIDKDFNDLTQEQQNELGNLNIELMKSKQQLNNSTAATQNNTQAQSQNAGAQKGAAAGAAENAAANTALAAAETAAATAGRVLKGVLISLGIGLAIVLISELVSSIYNWVTGTEEQERKQKALNDQLRSTNELIDLQNATYRRSNAERIAELKANGATEQQIRTEQIKLRKGDLVRAQQDEIDARNLYNKNLGKVDAETLKTLGDNLTKREQETKNILSSIRILEFENSAAIKKEREKTTEENKTRRDKDAADQLQKKKEELDALIQLEINKANTDKTTLEKLLKQRTDLDKLDGARLELAKQNNTKRTQEALDEDKKANDDRIKTTEEFNRRIRDIKTAAIADDVARQKQARLDKLNDDLADLEKDKEFIAKSEEEKEEIRQNLRIAYNNEINKIDEEQRLKEKEDALKAFDERLRILELQGQALLRNTRGYFENRAAILKETEARELKQLELDLENKKISQENYEKAITAVAQKYSNLRKQLKEDELYAIGQTISATFDSIANLTSALASSYDEEAQQSEAAFEKRKKLQIATAVMSAAGGIIQILTQPSLLPSPFDWIVKGINAAALAIATGVNISKIKNTQFEAPESEGTGGRRFKVVANRASGGIVTGPGTSTSDSIPAMLSNGEYVVNARATSAFLPILSAINDAGRQPRFAGGGLMAGEGLGNMAAENISKAISSTMLGTPVKTYVVGTDMTNQQQFDRTIKSRSII